MPEPQSSSVVTEAAPIRAWQMWVIGVVSLFFLLLPFALIYSTEIRSLRLGGLGWERFFYVLAMLPGAIGILHHIISSPLRRLKVQQLTKRYFDIKSSTGTGDGGMTENAMTSVVNACAASLLLTGVFFIVAVVADARYAKPNFPADAPKTSAAAAKSAPAPQAKPAGADATKPAGADATKNDAAPAKPDAAVTNNAAPKTPAAPASSDDARSTGIILSGLGAYVAVLYYMAGRLYANALSSRFLLTSALRSASAIALGYVLARAGMAEMLPSTNTTVAAFFLVGLFHNWAMNAMRTQALTLLGAPKSDNDELPMTIIEGVEDTSADLLSEYGVSTVQHLAQVDAGELSERTLIPLDRVLDWTDQALLIQRVKRGVTSTRSVGVRTATDFARQYLRKVAGDDTATKLLASIAEKSALGAPAVDSIGREFASDSRVALIYKTLQGTDLSPVPDPVAQFDAAMDRSLRRYDVVGVNDATPVGRLSVRPPAPAAT